MQDYGTIKKQSLYAKKWQDAMSEFSEARQYAK